jgi:hypothetical protein
MIDEHNNKIQGSGEIDPHERRRHARYPFTATVEAVELKSQTRIQGRTSDLGRGGCYVDTTSSFAIGSVVKMRLTEGTRSFETRAEVVYSLGGMGMGVKFTEVDLEQRCALEKWVAEISGETLPGQESARPSLRVCAQPTQGKVESQVLNELLLEIMKQGLLPNEKCKAMLQKLNRVSSVKSNSAHA